MARKRKDPKYCRHKASGRAYARFGDRNAPPTYFGRYGTPEAHAAYLRALEEYKQTGRREAAPAEGCLVAELVEAFLHWAETNAKYRKNGQPTSQMSLFAGAFGPLVDLFGTVSTGEIGPKEFDLLRSNMLQRKRVIRRKGAVVREIPWDGTTVRRYLRYIRGLFDFGEGRDLVPVGTVAKLKAGQRGLGSGRRERRDDARPPVPCAPAEAVEAVLEHIGEPFATMMRLQLLTGMRPGGVCAMRPADIEIVREPAVGANGRGRKARQMIYWLYREPPEIAAKTGSEKHWLGPQAQRLLEPYLEGTPVEQFLFRCAARPGKARHGRITRRHYTRSIARCCARCGVEHFSPNQLRHSHLTEVERKYNLDTARARGGHTTPNTTAIYIERDDERAKRVAREMG
jgi:integrase